MSTLNANDIASLCLHGPTFYGTQLRQTEHRISLVSKWPIPCGAKVLELGCGQGDCTAVIAEAVGNDGHVVAVDPGELTYGAPYTLGQSQSHLSSGPLGSRITWKQADPIQFLESDPSSQYDVAVLAHCLWYFASPAVIGSTLRLLASRARCICIAEWSLSSATADTHVLAALAQAALECRKPETSSNVRTVVSPDCIKEIAADSGLTLESESVFTPATGMEDGKWEVQAVLSPDFGGEIDKSVRDGRERSVVIALRDAVKASLGRVEGGIKHVVSMDVWCGVFSPA